jgi:uncharacterized membrane protein
MPIQDSSNPQASAEIPPHLNRWNWGAFLLNWIWGIGNSVWIALLCLIPGVNIVMMFVLGFKGSKWAWRNRLWRDEEQFRKSQRRWAIAGVLVLLAVPLLIGGIWLSILGAIKGSEPYRMSMEGVRSSAAVKAVLGERIEPGYFVSGQLQINGGDGRAAFEIPLHGSDGEGTAYSHALKKEGVWDLIVLIVRVPGRQDPIVIINKSKLPLPGSPLDT